MNNLKTQPFTFSNTKGKLVFDYIRRDLNSEQFQVLHPVLRNTEILLRVQIITSSVLNFSMPLDKERVCFARFRVRADSTLVEYSLSFCTTIADYFCLKNSSGSQNVRNRTRVYSRRETIFLGKHNNAIICIVGSDWRLYLYQQRI